MAAKTTLMHFSTKRPKFKPCIIGAGKSSWYLLSAVNAYSFSYHGPFCIGFSRKVYGSTVGVPSENGRCKSYARYKGAFDEVEVYVWLLTSSIRKLIRSICNRRPNLELARRTTSLERKAVSAAIHAHPTPPPSHHHQKKTKQHTQRHRLVMWGQCLARCFLFWVAGWIEGKPVSCGGNIHGVYGA